MFNQNDALLANWKECCDTARSARLQPVNYFVGLPEPTLTIPKNVLLFKRSAAMTREAGTAHHRFLWIMCLEGEGSVIVDDAMHRLRPGLSLLVTPFQFHHYADFSDTALLWLFLSFELNDLDELENLRGRLLELSAFQVECIRRLVMRFSSLEGRPVASSEITLLVAMLLEELRSQTTTKSGAETDSRELMQAVAGYVHRYASSPIKIRDVAQGVGISESHLRARFRSLAGIGLGNYIQNFRIHLAKVLLRSSDLRLAAIAKRCGYDSIHAFSRAFRREAGESPSSYRKSASNGGPAPTGSLQT